MFSQRYTLVVKLFCIYKRLECLSNIPVLHEVVRFWLAGLGGKMERSKKKEVVKNNFVSSWRQRFGE